MPDAPNNSVTSFRWKVFSVVLPALGVALLLTNRWFPAVDDECAIIDAASHPLSYTLRLYFLGGGEHEHPPLYDVILHGWLVLTGGRLDLLRVPAVTFYVLGAWALAAAARRLGGRAAAGWALLLIVLWPFGFHFGRLAAWYSFCFLFVCLLTWAYLRYVDEPSRSNWTLVVVCALVLIYSNYFGWAFLGLLMVDYFLRDPVGFRHHWKRIAAAGGVLVVSYIPILGAFSRELHAGIRPSHSLLGMVLNCGYNLYCLFVSESVAPWFFGLAVPAVIAIAVCLVITLQRAPWPAKRILLYFCALLAVMTALGIIETKRLLFVAPWLILPVSVTLGTLLRARIWRRVLVLSLMLPAAIGWYGIFARNLYAAPHWVEPWREVSRYAASVVQSGGVVVADNPTFFFYLTYDLPQASESGAGSQFHGLLPNSVRRQGVYDPRQWLTEDQPIEGTTLLVRGMHYGPDAAPTITPQLILARGCSLEGVRRMVYDTGVAWKRRIEPAVQWMPWRVEVDTFRCERAGRLQGVGGRQLKFRIRSKSLGDAERGRATRNRGIWNLAVSPFWRSVIGGSASRAVSNRYGKNSGRYTMALTALVPGLAVDSPADCRKPSDEHPAVDWDAIENIWEYLA